MNSKAMVMTGRTMGEAQGLAVVSDRSDTRGGLLGAVEALFMRLLQQSPGMRPNFAENTAPVKGGSMIRHGEQAFAEATGAGPDGALLALYEHLHEALRLRILSDLATWERVTGEPWEGLPRTLPRP